MIFPDEVMVYNNKSYHKLSFRSLNFRVNFKNSIYVLFDWKKITIELVKSKFKFSIILLKIVSYFHYS